MVVDGVARWLRGSGNVHWPNNLGPPQNPTTWTTQVRVPYAPKYLQATPWQKYIEVTFPINCRVARWLKSSGDIHWPQNLGHMNAGCAGQTRCVKTLGPWACLCIKKPCPSHWSTAPVPPRKVLEPEARRRTLQKKTYSFVVATAILAR